MSDVYEIYWIHLAEHTDITKQGYIGITKRGIKRRMYAHMQSILDPNKQHITLVKALKKYKDLIEVDVVCIGDKEYAKWLERTLRPTPFVGWNMNVGGFLSAPRSEESKRISAEKRKISMTGKYKSGQEHWNWKGGISLGRHIKKPLTHEQRMEIVAKSVAVTKGVPLKDEHKEKLSQRKLEYFEEFGSWSNSQANKHLWKEAQGVYEVWLEHKCSDRKLCRLLGLKRNKSILNMIKLFRGGWVPCNDERFMRFIDVES